MPTPFAVIGGTGLYRMQNIRLLEEVEVPTPFGLPSDRIAIAEIVGTRVAFLPRHGRGHRLLPTEVPSRANIWALKSLGVEQILSVSAVGSLNEAYRPGDFVVCDQLIDRTRSRANSFFGDGVVGHVVFADPFCREMREGITQAIRRHNHPVHPAGTLVTMEGPLFSTRAESFLYRGWNAHLIGMTALPEAKLAREAEICYAVVAMVTDYDCWKESEESVTIEMVLKVMEDNTRHIQRIIPDAVAALRDRPDCACRHAAATAIMTDPALIPYDTKRRLWLFYGKYWDRQAAT
jgi:5'-methylthioadenosine phosphorylase